MLLLSIHPRFVDAILAGTKQVELRRRQPRVSGGGGALIYATAPRMELVASFRIASLVRAPLDILWRSVRDVAGVSRSEFDAYFTGLQSGVAIGIADVLEFPETVDLKRLRDAWKEFHPPQGFRYITGADFAKLQIGSYRRAA
jgi:predicted transcriptional regulator